MSSRQPNNALRRILEVGEKARAAARGRNDKKVRVAGQRELDPQKGSNQVLLGPWRRGRVWEVPTGRTT